MPELALLIVVGAMALGFVFACIFTDWHQVQIVEEHYEHCNHTHKKYI